MHVLAIGESPFELAFASLGTINRFMRNGAKANLIVISYNNKKLRMSNSSATSNAIKLTSDESKEFPNLEFVLEPFDFRNATQQNVNIIQSRIKAYDPTLVIIPSLKSSNERLRILAHSSLLAVRTVRNVLTYELDRMNNNILPNIHVTLRKEESLLFTNLSAKLKAHLS
jgi:hypothetical protein